MAVRHFPHLVQIPATREAISLLSVERAISDLRRGRPVLISGGSGVAALTQASEGVSDASLTALAELSRSQPVVVVTARRAFVLGLTGGGVRRVAIARPPALSADLVRRLADPMLEAPLLEPHLPGRGELTVAEVAEHGCESAAVTLAKVARLLPAALVAEVLDPTAEDQAAWATRHDLLHVDAGDVFQYQGTAARGLYKVGEARVPLEGAEQTRMVAFRPRDGGGEHLALVIGEPSPNEPVLTRLHSECFTGDLLGSLRCDCGDQLRGAIAEIARTGGGLVLYLAQEGRGIGLVNKLRAYELQDRGFDTVDANEQLGFEADERLYLPAAQMLRTLGYGSVRLLTNNPGKVEGLVRHGITVSERVPHRFPVNPHNEIYLQTKAARGGHLF